MLNGILDVANRIELGQIRAGLVVSCESAREINDIMIARMLEERSMEHFAASLATLTGGSGAVAVLLTDGSFSGPTRRRLLGGMTQAAPEHHGLCLWGMTPDGKGSYHPVHGTDAVNVMNYGVELGRRTWEAFLPEVGWQTEDVDRVICHQVGSAHQSAILKTLDIPRGKGLHHLRIPGQHGDRLPAAHRRHSPTSATSCIPGDRVGFLGIGSGLNCLMLG